MSNEQVLCICCRDILPADSFQQGSNICNECLGIFNNIKERKKKNAAFKESPDIRAKGYYQSQCKNCDD